MNYVVWNGTQFSSTKNRIAVVTFATGRYIGHDEKLRVSVNRFCPQADVFTFRRFDEIQSPQHSHNPYAFKVYAIHTVRSKGYDIIIWMDSINRVSKPLDSFLKDIETVGVYLPDDGWKLGEWANDNSLNYFGVSRDDAMKVACCYACILGFDFRHPITSQFFTMWKKACDDGVFQGMWDNTTRSESQDPRCRGHRHDQTCADLIAYKLGIVKSKPLLGERSEKLFTSFRYP